MNHGATAEEVGAERPMQKWTDSGGPATIGFSEQAERVPGGRSPQRKRPAPAAIHVDRPSATILVVAPVSDGASG